MGKAGLVLVAASALAALAVAFTDDVGAQTPAPRSDKAVRAEMDARAALQPASAFTRISDPDARSVALFGEIGKVISHPRCANCHPVDHPAQGDDRHPHMPIVSRGPDGHGQGLRCQSCHTGKNVWAGGTRIVTVPGDPHWALAPASMAWQGKSLGDICRQMKDPARNGNRTLAQIHEHMAKDHLVGWAWSPGAGRAPAPGSQAELGELVQAWIDTGAKCPDGGPIVPGPVAKAS